jgi:hypothetical protein
MRDIRHRPGVGRFAWWTLSLAAAGAILLRGHLRASEEELCAAPGLSEMTSKPADGPPDALLARIPAGLALAPDPEGPPPLSQPVRVPGMRRFATAASELALLELIPWGFDRYVLREHYAFISTETVRRNFRRGFGYDSDTFVVNQSSHPYHGSLFFNAARENGYGFWGSSAFALAGSLIWECCMENTQPSWNDLVNTTLGGMTRGEVSHRLSAMIYDNTASGRNRIVREIAAGVLNPAAALNRLLRGEVAREFENPPDRFPSAVVVSVDGGYRRFFHGAHPNQWLFTLSFLYGDPFGGDTARPFDSFWIGVDASSPGGVLFSRIEERGVLKAWELTDPSDAVRHLFGFSQEYEYFNNASHVFGAQMLGAGLLSRYRIRDGVTVFTDASVLAIPLAGIRTTDFARPETGRNYDYAPGGGARIAGRLYAAGREVLGVGYAVAWAHTANGVSDNNVLQFLRAVVRVPLGGTLTAGAGYSWYSRKTSYPGFFEDRRTQSEWRVFANAALPFP